MQFRDKLRGYDPVRVDVLVEQIAVSMERSESIAHLLLDPDLGGSVRGYHPADVDAFLASLRSWRHTT